VARGTAPLNYQSADDMATGGRAARVLTNSGNLELLTETSAMANTLNG
jgi:hypothetical protein